MLHRLTALLVVTLSALPQGAARAQPVTPAEMLRVASISPWTDATHPFRLSLQITNTTELTLESVVVRVTFSSPVLTRSALRAALDQGVVGGTVVTYEEPVSGSIPPGQQRPVEMRRVVRDVLTSRGIYPVTIAVVHAGGSVAATTAVPNFVPSEAGPINVAWILPVTAPTIQRGGEPYTETSVAGLGLELVAQQLAVLAARPGAQVTLAPNPSLVATLGELAGRLPSEPAASPSPVPTASPSPLPGSIQANGVLSTLRAAAANVAEVATVPFAPADLRALASHDLRADVLRQVTAGRTTVSSLLGRAPSPGVLVPGRFALDETSASVLDQLGVDAAVLDATVLRAAPSEPADLQPQLFGPSTPVPASAGRLGIAALLPDPAVRDRLNGTTQGALLSQAIIAETLGSWQELPAFAPRRLFVIASDRLPDPTALAAALDGLTSAPWVRMLGVSDALAALPPQGEPIQLVRAQVREQGALVAARAARAALRIFTDIVLQDPPTVGRLDRLILLAESAEWEADQSIGVGLARAAGDEVGAVLTRIEVAERRVTLTSRTGSLPITVINDNTFAVRVRLRLEASGVAFPGGSTRLVDLANGPNTFDVDVEARGSGSFPLTVWLETPDGTRTIGRGTLRLRSTAVSAVSLAAVAGSAIFLLIAWVRRALAKDRARGRRPSRRAPATPPVE